MKDRIFGYEVLSGRYQIDKKEAEYIRLAFTKVISNQSFSSISDEFNQLEVKPRKKGAKWNASMINNMIRNLRYSGDQGYPKIVSRSIQMRAIAVLDNKNMRRKRISSYKRNADSPFFRMIFCKNCGNPLWLYEKNEKKYWRCTADKNRQKCGVYHKWDGILDQDLNRTVSDLISELMEEKIPIQNIGILKPNLLDIVKTENLMKKTMNEETDDFYQLNEYLSEKHRIQYRQYEQDWISETILLKKRISNLSQPVRLTGRLLRQIIRQIKIDGNGNVLFELTNHQCIEKRICITRRAPYV